MGNSSGDETDSSVIRKMNVGLPLKAHGHDPEMRLQVAALIGSLDDTLSDEYILEELKALKAGGPVVSKVFAENSEIQ